MSKIFFGEPKDVKVGDWFPTRAALIEAGLHRHMINGIDGNGIDGAAAIVLSGGYEDDIDREDEIHYTGEGGNDTGTGKQIAHQTWDSPGNKGLLISYERKLPVRVIRGSKHNSRQSPKTGYKYSGLYRVEGAEMKIGKSGFKICRFQLFKISSMITSDQPTIKEKVLVLLKSPGRNPKWFSVGIGADEAQEISTTSKMAQLLMGKKAGDFIEFGPGFEIVEVRKYLS